MNWPVLEGEQSWDLFINYEFFSDVD